jgi:membrane peptidoglycan carboxypeptidase
MPDTKRTASGVAGGVLGLIGLSAVAGVLITATVTPAIALSGAAASSAITMFDNLPSVLDIDKLMLPTTIYAKDPNTGGDIELATFYDQNRSPVDFDEVAPVMYDAILSSEDPRFYQHGGVDLIGTSRALLQNLQGGGETQGGSSISQQYVKNVLIQRCESNADAEARTQLNEEADKAAEDARAQLIKDGDQAGADAVQIVAPTNDEISIRTDQVLANCWTEATTASGNDGIERKLQEMRYAIALEQKYSKNDILLGYLNISNFGGRTYGIDAAARYYFNVSAKDLSVSQAATLAGIVQNPNTYRIDQSGGSIFDGDGVAYNKAPDGLIDDVRPGQLAGLDTLLADGTITQEQYLAAADGYTSTKGRQLYVLSRLLDDGKITQEQYIAAAIEPITPSINPATTGCSTAGGSAYFCQYVRDIIENDPAFGATAEEREKALKRGGLSIYTSLDLRVQLAAEASMTGNVPSSVDFMKLGSTIVSIESTTGRVLAIAQNTQFSEDASAATDPNKSALVFAGDSTYGSSNGFNPGSTFKLFTLIDWLEKGHSVNETLNGQVRVLKRLTNSCEGDWVNQENTRVGNFGGAGGYTGTPMSFTRDSLNSGFFAMAEKLDLCDIEKVATKMGVRNADGGGEVEVNTQFSIIGSSNVSPIAMAGAYATVANNGIYCQPKAIDRVVDSDGNEMTPPATTCTQVIDPKVAATAAYALEGVMDSGGTGSRANPYDGTPLIGKTGTHETYHTWMIESSTKVTTAAWVGNIDGFNDVFEPFGTLRYILARETQGAADAAYGGDSFPEPDSNLMKRVLTNLPNVVGMSIDDATDTLDSAGFDVIVGDPVDSPEAAGIVASQDPGAGMVAGGTTVTIRPSNGQGTAVPDVSGVKLSDAQTVLRGAGFGNVQPGTCTVDETAGKDGKSTGTNPPAGTVVNRNAAISVNYSRDKCP